MYICYAYIYSKIYNILLCLAQTLVSAYRLQFALSPFGINS